MNAADFITEEEYKELVDKVNHKQHINYFASRIVGKRRFTLRIMAHKCSKNVYPVSVWIDIEGQKRRCGNNIMFSCNDFNTFKDRINEQLRKHPEFTETEQIRLF